MVLPPLKAFHPLVFITGYSLISDSPPCLQSPELRPLQSCRRGVYPGLSAQTSLFCGIYSLSSWTISIPFPQASVSYIQLSAGHSHTVSFRPLQLVFKSNHHLFPLLNLSIITTYRAYITYKFKLYKKEV